MEFYSTAAQVIPVIFLAYALDTQRTQRPGTGAIRWVSFAALAWGILVLVLAEAAALRALDSGPTDTLHFLVTSGLAIGASSLLSDVLAGRVAAMDLKDDDSLRAFRVALGVTLLLLTGIGLVALL